MAFSSVGYDDGVVHDVRIVSVPEVDSSDNNDVGDVVGSLLKRNE